MAMDYMCMNEMTDDTNSPILEFHDTCSEGVAREEQGCEHHQTSWVFRDSNQEPAIRSMGRHVVESFFLKTISNDGCVVAKR